MKRRARMTYRTKVYAKQPYCFWCGQRMILKPLHGNRGALADMATIEHLIQQCKGGSDDPKNLRLVHNRCNK